jgi:hypothetical protein
VKKISRRKWMAGIAIAVMILFTVIVPPNRSQITEGSTYSRDPSGYAGWYAFMAKQGVKVQRWQKPFAKLNQKSPITLVRIRPELSQISYDEQDWVDKGNHLIVLGVRAKATEAPFSSEISSKFGAVKIETSRRRGYKHQSRPDEQLALAMSSLVTSQRDDKNIPKEISEDRKLLEDEFGGIVWKSQNKKEGTLIASTTPYLGANAYQNAEGNFKFLARLATSSKTPIYVDEYIHGYKDKNVDENAKDEQTWISYLMGTPIFAGAVQALVVLLVLIIAKNWRFGAPIAPESISINNSQAYIEALSSVLQKAQRREFVWQAIAKSEQKKLQKKLGIGQSDRETLITAWVQQTGRSQTELEYLLNPSLKNPNLKNKPQISEQELLNWLLDWQKVLTSL